MSNDDKVHLKTNEARAGRKVKGMTIVLALSTLAAILIMMMVYAGNASALI